MAYIESVKLELIQPSITQADITILANRVVVEKEIVSKSYRTALKQNKIEVAGYHLYFTFESDQFEFDTSGSSIKRDAIFIQNCLDQDYGDNYIYPNSTEASKKYKIIGTGDNPNLYSTTFGVRDNTNIVTARTKDLLDITDLYYFHKDNLVDG